MKRTVLLLAVATLIGCNNEPAAPALDSSRVLLEIEYINYAWTPTYKGFFIDGAGDIYSYDREGAQWAHQEARSVTDAQLMSKYLNRTLVSSRDSADLPTVAARIALVDVNQVSPQKAECADAGILKYKAYKFGDGKYTPVVLRAEGDFAQQNTSAAAQELIAYVRSLGLWTEMPGCDP